MNLVIPMASPRESSRAMGGLPLYLRSFHGTTLLEHTIALAARLTTERDRVVFVMDGADATAFPLRRMVEVALPKASVVTAAGPTQGALCTILLATDHLALDEPLLVIGANALHRGLPASLAHALDEGGADAMTWTIRSVNPRLSFVRVTEDGRVLEASEKNPISNVATTGVFLFRTARLFLDAAFSVIKNEWHTKGVYFVAPVLNELIVRGSVVRATSLSSKPPMFFDENELAPGSRPEARA